MRPGVIAARAALLCAALACSAPFAKAADLAFLGPRGTYSEQATDLYRSHVPGFEQTVPLETITGVTNAVREGRAPRGIIPAVATTSGFPAETTRVLLGSLDPGIRIIGEVHIPIENDLLVKPGTKLADITTVISHPNALGEARAWLSEHLPHASLQEARSTAAAAADVAKGDGSTAAVAGPAAAKLYGLEVLASAIQDNKQNATSFWAIVKAGSGEVESHPDRIAVNLDVPADSAAFSILVDDLLKLGFSVIDVNSVPLPGELFSYRYMIVLGAAKPVSVARVARYARRRSAGGWRSPADRCLAARKLSGACKKIAGCACDLG